MLCRPSMVVFFLLAVPLAACRTSVWANPHLLLCRTTLAADAPRRLRQPDDYVRRLGIRFPESWHSWLKRRREHHKDMNLAYCRRRFNAQKFHVVSSARVHQRNRFCLTRLIDDPRLADEKEISGRASGCEIN